MTELIDLSHPDWNKVPCECRMPVVRFDGYDEHGEHRPVIVECGEQLFVGIAQAGSLDAGKYGDGLGYMVPAWKLECMGGHVLLVADIEDNEVELTPPMVAHALGFIIPPEGFGAGVALDPELSALRPDQLWRRAQDEFPQDERAAGVRYNELMRQAGHIIPKSTTR